MANPFTKALNSFQDKSVVNNVANPASAYSMMMRSVNKPSNGNAQTNAMGKALTKESKMKTFGTK